MASNDLGTFYNRSGARYSYYADKLMRIHSFVDWPRDKRQTPEELADAGFFFAGKGDCTRCFYCAGGLCNWLPGDQPSVEHARWFPQCSYLRSVKGDEFVDNVHVNFPRIFETEDPDGENEETETTQTAPDLDDIVERVMNKPCGEAMLVLGYSPDLVRSAITSVLSECGWDESQVTSERLAHITLDMEDTNGESSQAHSEKTFSVSYHEEAGATAMESPSTSGISASSVSSEGTQDNGMVDLVMENRRLKEQLLCKVCMDREVSIALLPCGHLVTCDKCCSKVTQCPLCRRTVAARVKTYL